MIDDDAKCGNKLSLTIHNLHNSSVLKVVRRAERCVLKWL